MRYSFHGGLSPKKKTSADALVVSRHMLGNSSAANAEPISLPDKPLRDFSFDEILSVAKEANIRTPLAPTGLDEVISRSYGSDEPPRIVVNCTSCEDGVFLNRYLCRERAEEIANGTKILMKALGAREAVLVVDDGDLFAVRALEPYADGTVLSLHVCEQKAPAAHESLLVYLAYKKEIPSGKTAENGFAVFDAEACSALFRAFAYGERMTEKLLCLTHLDGREELISARFGLSVSFTSSHRDSALLVGGAISGRVLADHANEKIEIDGSYDAVRIMNADQVVKEEKLPCIDCGRCAEHCPMYLDPSRLIKSKKKLPEADVCIKCGVCSAVCPSALDCTGDTRPAFRRYGDSLSGICLDFLIALAPAIFWGIYAYGVPAALILTVCALCGAAGELILSLIMRKRPSATLLCSSAVSGILCGMMMPSQSPLYLCAPVAFVCSLVFVGLFRVLKIPKMCPQAASFSVFAFIFAALSSYVYPLRFFEGGSAFHTLSYLAAGKMPKDEWYDLLFGRTGGAIGAISAFLIIIGGLYLVARKLVDLRIPISFFVGTALVTYLCSSVPNPFLAIGCVLCTGSTALGAFFLAPQTICTPKNKSIRYIYGLICGGGYVYLSTLLPSQPMLALALAVVAGNVLTRLLDFFVPKAKPFGMLK